MFLNLIGVLLFRPLPGTGTQTQVQLLSEGRIELMLGTLLGRLGAKDTQLNQVPPAWLSERWTRESSGRALHGRLSAEYRACLGGG